MGVPLLQRLPIGIHRSRCRGVVKCDNQTLVINHLRTVESQMQTSQKISENVRSQIPMFRSITWPWHPHHQGGLASLIEVISNRAFSFSASAWAKCLLTMPCHQQNLSDLHVFVPFANMVHLFLTVGTLEMLDSQT